MIKIALLGFGNVGRAFARRLEDTRGDHNYRIAAVADVSGGMILDRREQATRLLQEQEPGLLVRDCAPPGSLLKVDDFIQALPAAGVEALVECMPTNIVNGQPALKHLHAALQLGIPAITVDKGPIVHGFAILSETARQAGAGLAFTGTTGVRPPAEVAGRRIREIRGVLNGTTNYILTQMLAHSASFTAALRAAQKLGIAEPDPTLDIEGWDAACKILILANQWMDVGAQLHDVLRTGIGPETESDIQSARARGLALRLIGRAHREDETVHIGVAPEMVGPDSPFFSIKGTSKGAVFVADDGQEFFAASRSGRDAIAAVIFDDLQTVTASRKRQN